MDIYKLGVNVFKPLLLVSFSCLMWLASAEETAGISDTEKGPQQVIQEMSNSVIVLVERHRETFEENPDVFHQDLVALMEPVVAFSWISKNVMGKKYYRQATESQISRFEENFRSSLVKTYAKGFFSYNGEEINILSPEQDPATERTVQIVQEIKTEPVVSISYTMGKSKSGEWRLKNMVVNGINMGQTLNSQFRNAMLKEGNLDKVIDEWGGSTNELVQVQTESKVTE